jgi:hypothetical protein
MKGPGINCSINHERAAERHGGRSHAGASERELLGSRSAEPVTSNRCAAIEGANVAAVGRVVEEQRPRVVTDDWARDESGRATNVMPRSNKERRRRRREERKRDREVSVV